MRVSYPIVRLSYPIVRVSYPIVYHVKVNVAGTVISLRRSEFLFRSILYRGPEIISEFSLYIY